MLEFNKENFEAEVLQAEGYVVVDFWGDGCEPCKAFMPEFEALAEEFAGKATFGKLNTSKARRLAISQRVLGLPTIIIYKNGEKVAEVTGKETSKQKVQEMLEANL